MDDIQAGDTVVYIDAKSGWGGKGWITIHIELVGIWDGTKVSFDDKDQTTVYTKHWLKKIERK